MALELPPNTPCEGCGISHGEEPLKIIRNGHVDFLPVVKFMSNTLLCDSCREDMAGREHGGMNEIPIKVELYCV